MITCTALFFLGAIIVPYVIAVIAENASKNNPTW